MFGDLIQFLLHAQVHDNDDEDYHYGSSNWYAANVEGLRPIGLEVGVDQACVVLAGVHIHIAGEVQIMQVEWIHFCYNCPEYE